MNDSKEEVLEIEIIDDFILNETDQTKDTEILDLEPFLDMQNNEFTESEIILEQEPHLSSKDKGAGKVKKKQNRKVHKSQGNKILIIFILLIAMGVTSLVINHLKASNPKQLMVKGIEKIIANFENLYDPIKSYKVNIEGSKTNYGNISLNLKTSLNEELPFAGMINYNNVINNINNTKITYSYQNDVDSKKNLLNLIGNMGREDLFNIKFLNIDNKQYIFLKDIFAKYIEVGTIEDLDKTDINQTTEEITYLWKALMESSIKNIKTSYINTEKVNINYNNKDLKVKKSTLTLNKENQKELFKKVFSELKENKRVIEILKKYNLELKEINIDEKVNALNIEQEFIFSIYYKEITNEIIIVDFSDIESNNKVVYKFGNEDTIEFFENNKSVSKIALKIEPDKFVISGKTLNNFIFTINGGKVNKHYSYNWNLINDEYTLSGYFNLKNEEIKKDIEYNISKDFNIKVSQKGNVLIDFSVLDNGKSSKGSQINENINEFVNISALEEDNINEIMMGLYSIVMKILSN